ncbi:MAG TPA: alpha/beta fold hydrolase [Candidatus Sulfotelmatobacter sp.]|nr:alpha/beta fold hydrolase [Candidatus Sulfotelmatobacter sp.]
MSVSNRSAIVLVHGAFQNAGTWGKVVSELEAKNCSIVAVNLPGRDGDLADPEKLSTDDYKQAVLSAVSAQAGQVVLVGHSFGGITISNVAEAIPEKIEALVYLSAYLPQDGQSMRDLAQTDTDSRLGKDGNFVMTPDYKYAFVKPDQAVAIFGDDATGADREAIGESLIREPLAPMANMVKLTAERFGRVPKYYIETTADAVVSPALQERMMAGTKLRRTFKINAGHASYVTRPSEVAGAILGVLSEVGAVNATE